VKKLSYISKFFSVLISFFFVAGFTLPFSGKFSETFESYPVAKIPWGKTVALKSDLYKVSQNAAVSPDFDLTFSVESQYGSYQPAGLRKLAILLKEIELTRLLKTKASGDQVAQGAENSVRDIGRGFKLLATHPVGTVKNVGNATGEFFKKGGHLFSKKKRKTLKKPSLKERLFDGARRDVASEFGADVYTENPDLIRELDRIAQKRMSGSAAFTVAQFLVPVTLIGSVALTASGVSASADQMVNTKDAWELYDLNRNAFKAKGLEDEPIDQFLLENPYFNPREQTRIRFYLESLSSAKGWQKVFDQLSDIKSEKEAGQAMTALEMLMGLAERHKDFTEIGFHQGSLYAVTAQRQVFVLWPYDFVYANRKGETLLNQINGLKGKFSSAEVHVLNLGLMSSGMRSRLESLGIKTADGIFFKEKLNDDEISRRAGASPAAG